MDRLQEMISDEELLRRLREDSEEEVEEVDMPPTEETTEKTEEETAVEEQLESERSGEGFDAQQEAMYIKDGPLLWPRKEFMDREKIPRTRISFIAAERFNNFGWHPFLKTYIPFGCDLSRMQLLSLKGIEFLWFIAYLDASENLLPTHALGYLVHQRNLVALKLDNNKIDNIILPFTLEELMYLDISYNNIEKILPREFPTLETLRIDANKIKRPTNLVKRYFPKLTFLSLCHNQIESLKFPCSNNIVHLYLSYNKIRSLEGLEGMFKLRTLHLRANLIMTVSNLSTDLVSLEYLNLRDNKISDLRCIEHLAKFEFLEDLIVTGNPFTLHPVTRSTYKNTIIQYLPHLMRINKLKINDGMRSQAEHPGLFGMEDLEEEHMAQGMAGEELDSDDATEEENP